jgi:hypothetical protein
MTSPPAAGAYPGNPALSAEVRGKILSTFRHTLSMYTAGKYNDCLIGCEFILKMDPRFGPARRLLEKARNPNADVDMAELEMAAEPAAAAPDGTPPGEARRLLAEAVASLDGRDFETAIERAKQVIAAQPGNPEALEILEKASGRKAAQPLFDAVHRRADAALGEDHPEDARREVERMRLLDAGNPAIPLLERDIEAATQSGQGSGSPTVAPHPGPSFAKASEGMPLPPGEGVASQVSSSQSSETGPPVYSLNGAGNPASGRTDEGARGSAQVLQDRRYFDWRGRVFPRGAAARPDRRWAIEPGQVQEIDVTPEITGTFTAICHHFCGAQHANMKLTIIVE